MTLSADLLVQDTGEADVVVEVEQAEQHVLENLPLRQRMSISITLGR
jgi:hypothetical protein